MSLGDLNDPHAAAYWAASVGHFPEATAAQERAVWQQAFMNEKARADSNFRAWVTMSIVALLTNVSWIVWTFWK